MNTFALVQSTDELTKACGDLSDFLLFRRRQNPHLIPDTLLGICIDPSLTYSMPQALPASSKTGAGSPIAVVETLSLSMVWSLCWLARPVSRPQLIEGLKALSDRQCGNGDMRFVPVLDRDRAGGTLGAEMHVLRRLYPGLLMEPLYQERVTGRLFTLNSSHPRTRTMR